ncbi:MAG: hypothetical protein WC683_07950 [bacterium]|jgi:hypothetical protein
MRKELEGLTPKEVQQRIDEAFRRVAASADGQIVMGVLFAKLQLLETISSEEGRVRHNVAIEILRLFDGDPLGKKRQSELLVEQIAERAGP